MPVSKRNNKRKKKLLKRRESVTKKINKLATKLNNDSVKFNKVKTELDGDKNKNILTPEQKQEKQDFLNGINEKRQKGISSIGNLFKHTYWGKGIDGKKFKCGKGRIK